MLARRQGLRSLPAHALEVEEVVQKHGLALQHVEPVAAEPTALGHDYALGATLGDIHFGLEGVRRVEDARRVAVRRPGDLAGPGEFGAAGREAGTRRDGPGADR